MIAWSTVVHHNVVGPASQVKTKMMDETQFLKKKSNIVYLCVAVCQATAIIKLMGNSTGITSATMVVWHHSVLNKPLPAPAIKPVQMGKTINIPCKYKSTSPHYLTCRSIQIVNPAGNRFFHGGCYDSRSDDSKRNSAALFQQQVFGQCFSVGVSVGTLSNQSNKEIR